MTKRKRQRYQVKSLQSANVWSTVEVAYEEVDGTLSFSTHSTTGEFIEGRVQPGEWRKESKEAAQERRAARSLQKLFKL
jgi:hypothetical protein